MPKCQYTYESDSPSEIKFDCNEPSITNSKFCIFHDKDQYAEHEQEATKRFKEIVSESISQNKPLECIGYYLPAIDFAKLLEGKTFAQPVYFNEATFYEDSIFSGATFSKEADFSGATFSERAYFSEATFTEGASFWRATFTERAIFSIATFTEGANFWGATFTEGAIFSGATFTERVDFWSATFSKETSFSIATFSERVDFWKATFTEDSIFLGATFSKEASFWKATFSKEADFSGATFSERADFSEATFSERANFSKATFSKEANFSEARFLAETYFLRTTFGDITLFKYAIFGQPNKVIFDNSDLSSISFAGSDITTIRFGDKIKWRRVENDVTIIEEEWLKDKVKRKEIQWYEEDASLDLVLSAYRNLRENFEFRLKFDDGGKLFIREMELKRNYRHVSSKHELKLVNLHRKLKRDKGPLPKAGDLIKNSWFSRHFSLTGLYYHLSRYGESISRPALIGAITVFLSTLFWLTQSNPTLEPHFDSSLRENVSTSTFVGAREFLNGTQWLEGFERSLAGFIPLLSLGGETKVGIIDYIIKIFGGGLTFVLLAIALRRKFERKYTR